MLGKLRRDPGVPQNEGCHDSNVILAGLKLLEIAYEAKAVIRAKL
ncbi:hypothetical protein [Pyrococcus furiosus]|nr:hypothetical protein [Pyrococcus furiosus]